MQRPTDCPPTSRRPSATQRRPAADGAQAIGSWISGTPHRLPLPLGTEAEVRIDLFNVFDRQTGYNVNPVVRHATFGQPRSYFDPRRVQLAVGVRI